MHTGHLEVGYAFRATVEPRRAGEEATREAMRAVHRFSPRCVLVFASASLDLGEVLAGVGAAAGDVPTFGASATRVVCGGEHDDAVAVTVLASDCLDVHVGWAERVSGGWSSALDRALAHPGIAPLFDETSDGWTRLAREGKSAFALLFSPGSTRGADSAAFEIVERMKRRSLGRVPIFGGSASSDATMAANHVFADGRVLADGLVVAVLETELRFGIAYAHGFRGTGRQVLVTAARGHEVLELDGRPAADAYADLAGWPRASLETQHLTAATGQLLASADALGELVPNVATYVTPGGGVRFTRAVAPGAALELLRADADAVAAAGRDAARKASMRGGIADPAAVLVASCSLRTRAVGDAARTEMTRLAQALGHTPLVGFTSFGEQAVGDDGVSQHTSAVVAALALGAELTPAAYAARENAALRAEVEVRTAQQRALLDVIPDLAWLKDTDGRYLAVNQSFAAVHRWGTPEAFVGRTDADVFPPDQAAANARQDREVVASGIRHRIEEAFVDRDGGTRWFETIKVPFFDDAAQVAGVAGISRDISERRAFEAARERVRAELEGLVEERTAQLRTAIARLTSEVEERRRAEVAALRYERALRTLGEVNEAVVRAVDESSLFQRACAIAVERGGHRLAWIGLAESDEAHHVVPVARAGHDGGYVDAVDVRWDDSARGRGPVGTAIRTGEPIVARSVSTDERFAPWREAALRHGFGSMAALPLVGEGVPFGALAIYSHDVDAFDANELKLLADLAEDIAFGVMALRGRAQRAILRAQLMQADRLVAMGTLAAGVAHEINNPLAYVLAGLDFVAGELEASGGHLPPAALEDVCDALRDMRDGGQRIRQVVRDLKVFSRGDETAHGPVDVHRVVESSLLIAANEIRHRARVVKAFEPIPLVDANESRLGQVFLNLLINAAQAIPEGAADRNEIRVATSTDEAGRAVVEVGDTGVGMAPATVEHIFEPFFTTKPVGEGTGLGLAICRNIVHGLGGEITVRSALGEGSTFRLVLPACAIAAPAAQAEPRPAPAAARRILAVDDEPLVLASLRRMLGREHVVVAETSARAALDRLRAGERFDVLLCDLMMPEMTGMELFARIASMPDQARRVVFLTGGAFTRATRAFLDAVPNPRLDKPFDAAAVRRLVGEVGALPAS